MRLTDPHVQGAVARFADEVGGAACVMAGNAVRIKHTATVPGCALDLRPASGSENSSVKTVYMV